MPMVVSELIDFWSHDRQCFYSIGSNDVQEIFVLKQEHGSVADVYVFARYALYYPLEKFGYNMLHYLMINDH